MKLFNKILSIFLIITIMICVVPFKVQAVSSSLHASNTSINAGDTVSFYVTASDAMAFDGTISIDGDTVIGTVQADADDNTSLTSNTVSYTFNNPGTFNVSTSGTLGYWEDGQSKGTSLEGSVTITVAENSSSSGNDSSSGVDENKIPAESSSSSTTQEETKSSNNYLQSLSVSEGTLKPSFDRATTDYTVVFPDNFDWKKLNSINISASKEHEKASISGTGETTLNDGENTLKITVTAEDGSVRTYNIKITKPETLKQSDLRLKSLEISKIDKDNKFTKVKLNKDFDPEVFEYTLDVGADITSLDIDAKVEKEGITVSVEGEKNLKDGKNDVKITLKSKDDEDIKTTYVIKVNKEASNKVTNEIEEKESGSSYKGIIIGIIIFIILLVITLVVLIIINKRRKKASSIEYKNNDELDEEERNRFDNTNDILEDAKLDENDDLDESEVENEVIDKYINDIDFKNETVILENDEIENAKNSEKQDSKGNEPTEENIEENTKENLNEESTEESDKKDTNEYVEYDTKDNELEDELEEEKERKKDKKRKGKRFL